METNEEKTSLIKTKLISFYRQELIFHKSKLDLKNENEENLDQMKRTIINKIKCEMKHATEFITEDEDEKNRIKNIIDETA